MSNTDLYRTRLSKIQRRVAKGIQAAMREQGLTQTELAKRAGVNSSHLSEIINEKVNLKLETLSKIECGLGRSLVDIHIDGQQPFQI